ncbi:hypothetical protein [Desulfonatronum sp. SC1]|uniref:hypothetical protein n=1 Tax=Desulfonatronum sp. SC1 TaxID=2109626 RepID=UPI000D314B7C|nr:hypothetical protein [Desulfonatronum sp. SC1]PTN34478.1 hypothetical protein C6366_12780 [Desulfonatronum sp. SC1]
MGSKSFFGVLLMVGLLVVLVARGTVVAQDQGETVVEQPTAQPRQIPVEEEAGAERELQAVKEQGIPVLVEHQGADPVGMRLALHLKETFQKSALFRLAKPEEKHLSLRLVTRPQFTERPYLGSAYVLVWRYVESKEVLAYFLGDRLGFVDADMVGQEAEVLVAETDRIKVRYEYLLE